MKPHELNWSYMMDMFAEGIGEVVRMRDYLRGKVAGLQSPYDTWLYRKGFTEPVFEVRLEHAYHHLNWTWGCRHATLERAMKCENRDCRNLGKFPLAFRELLPDKPRRTVEVHNQTVLHFESILLGLDEVVRIGDELHLGLCAHFDEETCPRRWDRRAAKVAPLTERRLADLLRRLLGAMNFAWNVRRLPVERVHTLSETAIRHRCCYPAEFMDFLTKRHYRRRNTVRKYL